VTSVNKGPGILDADAHRAACTHGQVAQGVEPAVAIRTHLVLEYFADLDDTVTIVKSRRCHAHSFHNGHSVRRNNLPFLTLTRRIIVKTDYFFFHNCPVTCYLDLDHGLFAPGTDQL
jgi:hypothetical protein